jgi:hypothetical protein
LSDVRGFILYTPWAKMMKDGRVDFDFSNVYKVTGDPSSSIANGSITDVVSNY